MIVDLCIFESRWARLVNYYYRHTLGFQEKTILISTKWKAHRLRMTSQSPVRTQAFVRIYMRLGKRFAHLHIMSLSFHLDCDIYFVDSRPYSHIVSKRRE